MKTTTKIIIGLCVGSWILTIVAFGIKTDRNDLYSDIDSTPKINYSDDSTIIALNDINQLNIIIEDAQYNETANCPIVITHSGNDSSHISMPVMLKDFHKIIQEGDTLRISITNSQDLDYDDYSLLNSKTIYINLRTPLKSIRNNSDSHVILYCLSGKELTISGDGGHYPTVELNKCTVEKLKLDLADDEINVINSDIKNYTFLNDSNMNLRVGSRTDYYY